MLLSQGGLLPNLQRKTYSIHAELFELSSDGLKWILVEPRLLYVTIHTSAVDDTTRITATTAAGRSVVESRLAPGSKVERIAECFVFWRDSAGRTLAVNTLSVRDASAFLAAAAPMDSIHSSTAGLFQQSVSCRVSQIAQFDGVRVTPKVTSVESTVVAVNPLTLAFHYDHQLITVDLLECVVTRGNSDREIHLGHSFSVYQFEFEHSAVHFLEQILNLSSLLLARTTSSEVALTYLQRQRVKIHERISQLRSLGGSDGNAVISEERSLLKDAMIRCRIAALQHAHIPGYESLSSQLGPRALQSSILESPLPSIYVTFANLFNFRMWRKGTDIRAGDLRVLQEQGGEINGQSSRQIFSDANAVVMASPPNGDQPLNEMITSTAELLLNCAPSTSNVKMIPIVLPNGKTTMITHDNENPDQLLIKACQKLSVQSNLFDLTKYSKENGSTGWKMRLRQEYEVEKKNGRLGLTIYAHTDQGAIRAEVRGVASFCPGGPSVGDWVIAVDGIPIEKAGSAAEVEQLLREGRRIRLKRRQLAGEFQTQQVQNNSSQSTTPRSPSLPAPLPSTRMKLEERLHKGLQELLITERRYVDELKQMVDGYLSIRSVRDTMESALRLEKIQESFLESLEEAIGDAEKENATKEQVRDAVIRVCALFVNRCSDFKIYAEYAAAYLRLQQELSTRKDILAELEAANSTKAQHCSWESRMIKPVQRVVQYPLLLRTVAAGCERASLEARQVETALQKMQTLAEYVNEMQRIHEQFSQQIDQIRKTQGDQLKEKSLRIDVRDLLIFAHIRWLNSDPKGSQEYVIFVFSSLILLLPSVPKVNSKIKQSRVLPVVEVEIVEQRQKDGNGIAMNDGLLTLVHLIDQNPAKSLESALQDGQMYRIACCQPLLKQQLIKSIRKARTTFMKEQKRPLSGSSQSDAGYASESTKDRPNPSQIDQNS
ncbi:unnamed protein product, partial [Mesorhabditis belari]|uniref:DH domain-containing protein n=1 Tax=Mesorhabditis belari TaxID=2138241 RepID=A0AAF3ED97_9BILA